MTVRRTSCLSATLLAAFVFVASAGVAVGQTSDTERGITERTIPPSSPPSTVEGAPAETRAAPVAAPTTGKKGFAIPYTVRAGDTLGTVAQLFGVSVDDLAHANHITPDHELMIDDVLKVPNPFTAEVNGLRAQVESLNDEAQTAERKAESANNQVTALTDKVNDLSADNQSLEHSLRILPWWRGTAITLAGAAVLMFGVMLVTAFEWWRMRRRFVALVEMTDTLGHLDYKYKSMLAKAELRLQQLYGRRRPGITEGQPRPKTPEEMEIERLNEELREILERHLVRLGARPRGKSRSRWREIIGGEVNTAAEAEPRSVRR